jgi:pimeloyl-ACP methyl ester carboxylesterase
MPTGDETFRSGRARLRYRDEGAGRAAILVHGWTLDLEMWNPQAAALAGPFRIVRYDRRGFGLSEGMPGIAADCDDLGRLLDHLQLAGPILVGHSQGARVALAFAGRHPERVAGLVLDGPPDESAEAAAAGGDDFSVAEYRGMVREQGVAAFRRAWRRHPLMRLHSADAAAGDLVARMLERYPARDLLEPPVDPAQPAGSAVLARLATPVLVVNGEFDTPTRRRAGEKLARVLPRAERLVVPGAGHLPNLDNSNAYNAALRAFLLRQSRVAA